MTEKAKGLASDSFKRACFNWGIGRELYDYPFIRIQLNQNEKKDNFGEWFMEGAKPRGGYGLKLKSWTWGAEFKDGDLVKLAAKDQNNKLRFNWKA